MRSVFAFVLFFMIFGSFLAEGSKANPLAARNTFRAKDITSHSKKQMEKHQAKLKTARNASPDATFKGGKSGKVRSRDEEIAHRTRKIAQHQEWQGNMSGIIKENAAELK